MVTNKTLLKEINLDEAINHIESDAYSNYIMDNCDGERPICNGDMLLDAVEDHFLFDEYLETLGLRATL
jgi:hypothetical protein